MIVKVTRCKRTRIPSFYLSSFLPYLVICRSKRRLENVLFSCHYFLFLPCPGPPPIDIRCNWNKIEKSIKPWLNSLNLIVTVISINQNYSRITTASYCKFGFQTKTIGCGKLRDRGAKFLKPKNRKLLLNNSPYASL